MARAAVWSRITAWWMASNANARSFSDMQPEAQNYVTFLEDELQVQVTFISVGPGREETVFR